MTLEKHTRMQQLKNKQSEHQKQNLLYLATIKQLCMSQVAKKATM